MKNALVSVYNKDGIIELAQFLAGNGWNIMSTGGTAAFLRQAGFTVVDVSERTGFAECLDGRVKTLHPVIHAGILARRSEKTHRDALSNLSIETIDLVCVNLYPFFEKAAQSLPFDELIEFIDIGGPAMLRSAAKNWRDVVALCDTADYGQVIGALKTGAVDMALRRSLAAKVFNLTASYDAAVARYMRSGDEDFPAYWTEPLRKTLPLRYGENAHQSAALYTDASRAGVVSSIKTLGGKELSYNNIRDLDLAWKCVCAFGLEADGTRPLGAKEIRLLLSGGEEAIVPCCAVVKHNTPCGIALGETAEDAFTKAYSCDPVSIFGGIVAFNVPVTETAAAALSKIFLEIVIAPAYEPPALELLRSKKNLRILQIDHAPREALESVSVDGGVLVQETNRRLLEKWETVTKTAVDPALIPSLIFALRAVTFVKSNGIVVASGCVTAGIGGGDTSRICAAECALTRAAEFQRTRASSASALTLASDAFLPFPDVAEAAGKRGIRAIAQSGGSAGDGAAVEACNRYGIAMVFTGLRCFKH